MFGIEDLNIGNTYIYDTYIKGACAKSTYIGRACIRDIYIKSVYFIIGASIWGTYYANNLLNNATAGIVGIS